MESTEAFIGGIFFIVIGTLIVSLFAMNKNIGFFGAWIIGLGLGALVSFILGTDLGLGVGILASLIAVVTSSNVQEEKPKYQSSPTKSVADELIKLNELKSKGVITEVEFQQQKAKLLKSNN